MSPKEDREFYDIWQDDDKPLDDQKLALEFAKLKSKRYSLDNRVYIVKGCDVFVVHSNDIGMDRGADGLRNITIKNGRMVKYTEDGERQTDNAMK